MRLTKEQSNTILDATREIVGDDVQVYLFGSRLDEDARGGDLDLLLVATTAVPLLSIAELKQRLEESLFLPVDILFYTRGTEPKPFQAIALSQAQPLEVKDAA